jgi:hypothetical protein
MSLAELNKLLSEKTNFFLDACDLRGHEQYSALLT